MKHLWALVAGIGSGPEEDDDSRLRRRLFIGASLAAVPCLAFYGTLYAFLGAPLAAAVMFAYMAICLINLIAFGVTGRGFPQFLLFLTLSPMIASFLLVILLGGLMGSAMHVVWGLLAPLGALVVYGPKAARRCFAAYVGVLGLGLVLSYITTDPIEVLDPRAISAVMGINIIGVSAFAFGIMDYFIRERDLALALLRSERERSEALLLNILPKDIVSVLKHEPRTIADHFEGASILFADVVDFTPMSEKMLPNELVDLLNEIFSYFDALVEKYDVEKIKTIGDCYMVASGVPRPRADHAHVLAHLALEMREFVNRQSFGGHRIGLRIGINSGPVVAGVIGRKKFIYDLWGDAVNTASRMESHGREGTIQITRATYELIKDDFVCVPRGTLYVKGKGEMEAWQIHSAVEKMRIV
ncbi:MAG TPA: adenylate/guanylate cyclase domain-containing protein [Candidatus Binatia bacterium]|nr:adenylate/guanylate cyclase domain-containing protein [Candidatus Binatia bacterium]